MGAGKSIPPHHGVSALWPQLGLSAALWLQGGTCWHQCHAPGGSRATWWGPKIWDAQNLPWHWKATSHCHGRIFVFKWEAFFFLRLCSTFSDKYWSQGFASYREFAEGIIKITNTRWNIKNRTSRKSTFPRRGFWVLWRMKFWTKLQWKNQIKPRFYRQRNTPFITIYF